MLVDGSIFLVVVEFVYDDFFYQVGIMDCLVFFVQEDIVCCKVNDGDWYYSQGGINVNGIVEVLK